MRLFFRLLCRAILVLTAGCSALLFVPGANVLPAYAIPLNPSLSLIQYTENAVQPLWQEGGIFSDILEQDNKQYNINYLAKQTNFTLNDALTDLKQKIKVTFSPRVVLKPFVIIEELQGYLAAYQSKGQGSSIHIDEHFQAKVLLNPSKLSRLKKVRARKSFAVSPYHNKIYGLHLYISW